MGALRTKQGQEQYRNAVKNGILKNGCRLCAKQSLEHWRHWRIVRNDFPYDRIAHVHHMLIPMRHATWGELSPGELREFASIKETHLQTTYDLFIEASRREQSIPEHFHLHLIISQT